MKMKQMKLKKILALLPFLLLIRSVNAHCPLCTIGAAAAAGGAAWLGISKLVIGVFIGAFAVSMGWWVSNLIKRRYIPFQRLALILLSFFTTIIPILPVIGSKQPVYISLIGGYGTLLNRTYVIDILLLGSILGGFIVSITPWLSKKITTYRDGRIFPYQGIILTFILLILVSAVIELAI